MRRQLFSVGLTLCFLLVTIIGCKKSDVISSDENTSPELSRSNTANTVSVCDEDVIDFENTNNFTFTNIGGANFLNTLKSSKGLGPIAVESYNPNNLSESHWTYKGPQNPAAVLFNSATALPTDEDFDLYSATLGMICVIQNFDPKYFPSPNDADEEGAWMTLNFAQVGKITAKSLTVIDQEQEEGENLVIKLYENSTKTNLLYTTTLSSGVGQGNVKLVNLNNTPNVGFIEVIFNGSIGIDDLDFCIPQTPPPPPSRCTYTQGYWKTHGPAATGNNTNKWPTSIMTNGLTLGTVSYTANQLQSILDQPVRGNGLVSLAHQLIAAKINIANGSASTAVQTYITQADALISNKVIPPVGTATLNASVVSYLVDKLTQYNEGTLPGGPSHCD